MRSNYILEPKRKRVALLDSEGSIFRVYESQSDAAFRNDTCSSAISKVCRGLKDYAKGKKYISITEEKYLELKN